MIISYIYLHHWRVFFPGWVLSSSFWGVGFWTPGWKGQNMRGSLWPVIHLQPVCQSAQIRCHGINIHLHFNSRIAGICIWHQTKTKIIVQRHIRINLPLQWKVYILLITDVFLYHTCDWKFLLASVHLTFSPASPSMSAVALLIFFLHASASSNKACFSDMALSYWAYSTHNDNHWLVLSENHFKYTSTV